VQTRTAAAGLCVRAAKGRILHLVETERFLPIHQPRCVRGAGERIEAHWTGPLPDGRGSFSISAIGNVGNAPANSSGGCSTWHSAPHCGHAWAITISAALQRGVPWPELRAKFEGTVSEPWNHDYTSLVDVVARTVDEMIAELRESHDRNAEQNADEAHDRPA